MASSGRPNNGQSWSNCDSDISQFGHRLIDLLNSSLTNHLVGIYLHGSLAMGSYYRPKSDIDIIVVVNSKLSPGEAKRTNLAISRLAAELPTLGGLELSLITSATAKAPLFPPPFELHYSLEWHTKIIEDTIDYSVERTDWDLPSHLTYVKRRGVCLFGSPIEEVFGEIPWKKFLESVLSDFKDIQEGERILEMPYYAVLNICRILQLVVGCDQIPRSKDEGALWALENLPKEYFPLIEKAVAAYHSPAPIEKGKLRVAGIEWDRIELLKFRDYAREKVYSDMKKGTH